MAGGILASRAAELALDLEVRTAGLYAQTIHGLSAHAVGVMREINIDISQDHPRQLDKELVAWADVIVTMGRDQGDEIHVRFGDTDRNLRILTFAVDDPYGEDRTTYLQCRDQIAAQLDAVILML